MHYDRHHHNYHSKLSQQNIATSQSASALTRMARRASYLKKRRFSKSANNVLDRHESTGSVTGNLDKQIVGKYKM